MILKLGMHIIAFIIRMMCKFIHEHAVYSKRAIYIIIAIITSLIVLSQNVNYCLWFHLTTFYLEHCMSTDSKVIKTMALSASNLACGGQAVQQSSGKVTALRKFSLYAWPLFTSWNLIIMVIIIWCECTLYYQDIIKSQTMTSLFSVNVLWINVKN